MWGREETKRGRRDQDKLEFFWFNLKGDSSVVGVRIGLVSWGSV